MGYRSIFVGMVAMFVVAVCAVSCNKLDDTVTTSQNRIRSEFEGNNIYERGNLPKDNPPSQIDGWFDIIKGAYRYIDNELTTGGGERDGRESLPDIKEGDRISFLFDARVYTGRWDASTTFYTNIESRRQVVIGSNEQAKTDEWPVVPMEITVGDDPQILKSLQTALISGAEPCKAAGTRMVEKTVEGEAVMVEESVESDIVRIYLTPDIAYGDKWVYGVPRGSTIVFELTDIHIIDN